MTAPAYSHLRRGSVAVGRGAPSGVGARRVVGWGHRPMLRGDAHVAETRTVAQVASGRWLRRRRSSRRTRAIASVLQPARTRGAGCSPRSRACSPVQRCRPCSRPSVRRWPARPAARGRWPRSPSPRSGTSPWSSSGLWIGFGGAAFAVTRSGRRVGLAFSPPTCGSCSSAWPCRASCTSPTSACTCRAATRAPTSSWAAAVAGSSWSRRSSRSSAPRSSRSSTSGASFCAGSSRRGAPSSRSSASSAPSSSTRRSSASPTWAPTTGTSCQGSPASASCSACSRSRRAGSGRRC